MSAGIVEMIEHLGEIAVRIRPEYMPDGRDVPQESHAKATQRREVPREAPMVPAGDANAPEAIVDEVAPHAAPDIPAGDAIDDGPPPIVEDDGLGEWGPETGIPPGPETW